MADFGKCGSLIMPDLQIHPDEHQFLDAIRAAPGDCTVRLVYADWLEEHDEPAFAEFIRLACQLDALSLGDPNRGSLKFRMDELSLMNSKHWIGEVSCLSPHYGHYQIGIPLAHRTENPWKHMPDRSGKSFFLRPPPRCLLALTILVCPGYGDDASNKLPWFDQNACFSSPISATVTSLTLDFGPNEDGELLRIKSCIDVIDALADSDALDVVRTPDITACDAHRRIINHIHRRFSDQFRIISFEPPERN